ncbi:MULTISPECIES: GlxA family transcriptional regulator [unclassified Leisingera]|uniref:GlxA family transcriptional regulator n=1 Tax=unclassified Leisingera TaxID=2614906 RepID=UPI000306C2BC|nr:MULTISPECIES: GlxA family transcriptional regulator [unclassified Leisingera]KIC21073.1 AraC family transcriptional regulator [Leisingera sp. ANG-S3]KIC53998.1 AraC family transcriptional regulator [Leisingera sp. ANG-S]KID09628.1 AraC family transcriptional regulator [Leisingera sp. ANG1]
MLKRNDTTEILILVTPHFNLAATMAFLDPFRAANYLAGKQLFQWQIASEAGTLCRASNGLEIAVSPLDRPKQMQPDIVVVSSSWTPEAFAGEPLLSLIRKHARAGSYTAGLDTAAFILAEAGLLRGKRATVHYEHIDALREKYPEVDVCEDLFVHEGSTGTCCGGAATGEFALFLLHGIVGDALTNDCAKYLFYRNLRGLGAHQTDGQLEPMGLAAPPKVRKAIAIMERHLETLISIPELCRLAGVSQRQLNRLFQEYVRTSPQLYYRDIRLDRSRGLVTQTELPISEIAQACGFPSHVHFARAYKQRFGLPPRQDRIEGRVPFEFRAWPMYRPSMVSQNVE